MKHLFNATLLLLVLLLPTMLSAQPTTLQQTRQNAVSFLQSKGKSISSTSLSQTHQVQSSELKDLTGEILITEGGNETPCYPAGGEGLVIMYDELWIAYTGDEDVSFTILLSTSYGGEYDLLNDEDVSESIYWDTQNNHYIIYLQHFVGLNYWDYTSLDFWVTVHADGYNDLSKEHLTFTAGVPSGPDISETVCSDLSAFVAVYYDCSVYYCHIDSHYNYDYFPSSWERVETCVFERREEDYYVTVDAFQKTPLAQVYGYSSKTILIPARECNISLSKFLDNEPQNDYYNYCCGQIVLDEEERIDYGEKESFVVVDFNQWLKPYGGYGPEDKYGSYSWNFDHHISIDGELVEDQYGYSYSDYPIPCVVDLLPYGDAFGGEHHIEVTATDGYNSLSADTVLSYHPIETHLTPNALIIDVNSGMGGSNLFVDGEEVELSPDGQGTQAHIYALPRQEQDYSITVQVGNVITSNHGNGGEATVLYQGRCQETTILVPARGIFDFAVDGVYYKITGDNEVIVARGEEAYRGVVIVPNTLTYDGVTYSVTGIDSDAFANADITHLVLPVTITTIDNTAFTNCHIGSLVITGNGTWTAGALAADVDQLYVMGGVTGIQGIQVNPATIYSYATVPPTCNGQTFTGYDGELHVPASSLASYFTASYWNYFINITGDTVEPTDVSLNKDSVDLLVGSQLALTATPTPANTTPGIIIWASSNEQVATVMNGEIIAVGVGECDIKAILLDKVAVCHVTVTEIPPTELTLNQTFAKLEVGSQLTLTATVLPEDATDKVVTWTTTNAAIATVDDMGNVAAISPGDCDITATCRNMQATCHVVVVEHLIFISLDQHEANLLPNHILLLTPSVSPVSTDLVVTSSDPAVAAARMANGKIQVVGITEGVTTITVGSADGYAEADSCIVTVYTERGDINSDGFVNMDDLTVLINYLLTNNPEGINLQDAADCDGHAGVGMDDLTVMINYLLTNQWPVDPVIPDNPVVTQTFTVNGVSFTMVKVDGSTFTMGATVEQGADAFDNEMPTHEVTLSTFNIGQTEVTQALWQAVMGSNPSTFSDDPNRPVECVTWNDCQTFITKLNQMTGQLFRLPTEAEWEFAARGGNRSQGHKFAGSDNIDDVCWYMGNIPSQTSGTPGYGTQPVAGKAPNELSLYDMSGNVWEWCQDRYGSYTSEAQTDPIGSTTGNTRVVRGGGWYNNYPKTCRTTRRNGCQKTDNDTYLGLRLALDTTEVYTVNGVSFTMVPVKGGMFTMGATEEEDADYQVFVGCPQHQVTLSSYSIGQTEVTQELWQAVMGSNPSTNTGDLQRPVETVTRAECDTFIVRLNALTGMQFRLPSEAEWEFAARGGNLSRGYTYAGSDSIGDVTWYKGNSDNVTHAVGTKLPNELGLYDMCGNVNEWVNDWYSLYTEEPVTNPTGPATGMSQIHRGGRYNAGIKYCRITRRDGFAPGNRRNYLGLRLAQ